MVVVIAGTLFVGLAAWIVAGFAVKRGIQEPPFEVLSRDGDIEVRRYRRASSPPPSWRARERSR
jgi:hypothetical protein